MTTLNATMDHMHMGNLASKAEPASKAASTSTKPLSQSDTDSDEKLLLMLAITNREKHLISYLNVSLPKFSHTV